MKKCTLLTILIALCIHTFGQTYQKLYPQNNLYDPSPGVQVAAAANNGTAFYMNRSLNIADSLGNIIISTPELFYASQMIRTIDGGYAFVAPQQDQKEVARAIKTDSVGNVLWKKDLADTLSIVSVLMKADNAGNIFLLVDSGYPYIKRLLKKYTTAGSMVWSKTIDPQTISFTLNSAGNPLLIGQSGLFFAKQLNVNGDSLWQKNYTHSGGNLYVADVLTLPSGEFLTLFLLDNGGYITGAELFRSDAAGQLLDSMTLSGNMSASNSYKLGLSSDGSITLYASSYDASTQKTQAMLTDISPFGHVLWQQSYLSPGKGGAFDICPLANGFIISGDTVDPHHYHSVMFVDRLDLSGLFYTPSVTDSSFYNSYGTSAVLDTNNIAANFNANGNLFCKDTLVLGAFFNPVMSGFFRVPKSGLANAIFASNIWVAGKNNGALYNSSEQYNSQYLAGPAHLLPQEATKWNMIWSINRNDVLSVKNDFDAHHAITQPIPASVLSWPAKGNGTASGREGALLNITEDMAPFVDRNGDGVYNVYDGDYPLIRGDRMLWWVNNDVGSYSTNPMGVDRRYSAYEYESPSDTNLSNTLFLSVTIKNQSPRNYDSVSIGSWVDFDLGCANNDRIGSIPSRNTFFVYNGYVANGTQVNGVTCDEGSVCPTGEYGYGCANPIMSATFLNDSMRYFGYYANGSGSSMGDPASDQQYYANMHGQWANGSPLTYGGNGFGGSTPCAFAFPGNPADPTQWSECNQQTGPAIAAGDRRCVGAIGPFTLATGDTISFDMALIFHQGPYDNCPDLSDSSDVSQHIDSIVRYYQTERFAHWYDSTKSLTPGFYNVGINEPAIHPSFTLIPNPNNGSFNIHIANPGQSDYIVSGTDMLGRVVYSSAMHAPDQTVRLDDATSGVYSVTIESKNYRETRKVVITK
jgi:hypothetical protein